MADQPGRRRQPFRSWFPTWSSPSRVSQRSRRQTQQKPPSITSQLLDSQPPTHSSQSPTTTGIPATPAKPSAEGEVQELVNGGKPEAQLTVVSPVREDKPSEPYRIMDLEEEAIMNRQNVQVHTVSEEIVEDKQAEEIEPGTAIEPQFHNSEVQLDPVTMTETEEICSIEEEPVKKVEAAEEIPSTQVNEELKKIAEPKLSIMVSDSEASKPIRVPEPDTRHVCTGKEKKIIISTKPRASSSNLEQGKVQQDLKDGISTIIQKLSGRHQKKLGNEQGVNIITLASENKGASMIIGCIQKGENTKHCPNEKSSNPSIAASINSNVQGINSSILEETNYRERSPGVHMTIFTKPSTTSSKMLKAESATTQKVTSTSTSPHKRTFEPGIRRRCLRGLLLESSEDDMENSQKPRRHGCRFTCGDAKKERI